MLFSRYNALRGHRTGSNNYGAEDYLRRKTNKECEGLADAWPIAVGKILRRRR